MVVRWCPDGDRTPPNFHNAIGWTPRRLLKFVEDVNIGSDLDGAAVLERAVAIGLATDRETANRWQSVADAEPVRVATALMGAASEAGFRLRLDAANARDLCRPVAPNTPAAKREVGVWVRAAGAFRADDAVAWDRHPAAHLAAPDCPHAPEGWAELGSFVPWMVAAGYAPSNAPRRMEGPRVAQAVVLVQDAVAGWETGEVDRGARWWSDDWYGGVGVGSDAAALFREAGWEPPLAAFLSRWAGGRVKAKGLLRRARSVPAGLLRRVWRHGALGLFHMQGGSFSSPSLSQFTAAVEALGPDVAGAWLDRFGSVAVICRLHEGGVTPELVDQVDRRWPGHSLFEFVGGMREAVVKGFDVGGWLRVALATHPDGEPLPPDAHVGVPELMPGWVADFMAAGVTNPAEALTLLGSGAGRDALALLGALRG